MLKRQVAAGVSAAEQLRTWLLAQQWFSSFLLPALPRWARWTLRRIYVAPLDLADFLVGGRDAMVPPREKNFTGAVSDFRASGDTLVQNLRNVAGLTPSSHVLDIGCGLGRLGAAATRYLGPNGAYQGIDIVPDAIEWCTKNIVGPFGNIRFTVADIINKEYNPSAALKASEYRFPFEDETFDVIVLISVFTHMLPAEVDNYLGEIARLLRPNGCCYASYFLVTDKSRPLIASRRSSMKFRHNLGTHWLMSLKVPELSVAYEESYVTELYAKHKLSRTFYAGQWSTGAGPGDQDLLIARKI
jgi:SAM-dependent methyltransferase